MTNIVIVGAGYTGVLSALTLSKKFKNQKDVSLTLINKTSYQLFVSNLYEVATAEEEFTTISQLKKSITIPLTEIFAGTKVKLVKAEVTHIDQLQKTITAGVANFPYDYLVIATGSVSDYFGIEGAEKFARPLKSLTDALAIKNQLEFAIQAHRLDVNKKNIHIVVAGGGYTGVELAAELSHEVNILAWKNSYPLEKIEITVVEALGQVISGFSERLSQDALWALKDRGVRVNLSSPIFKVGEHFVELVTGEKIAYDVLVWTTGVRARVLPFAQPVDTDRKGRLITNQFLQVEKYPNIFAGGDAACVINKDGKPAPPSAQDAVEHGLYLGSALPVLMQNQKPSPYVGKKHGFIVTVGGRRAIMDYNGFYIKGWLAYLVRICAQINYYRKVVGWYKAIWYAWFDQEMYSRND